MKTEGYEQIVRRTMYDNMLMLAARNAGQAYPMALRVLLERGDDVAPRGLATKELRPAILQFNNPLECLVAHPGRHLNPFFLMAEVLWMMAGRSDAEFITHYNSNLFNCLDDTCGKGDSRVRGEHFHGAYGERIRRYGVNNRLSYKGSYVIHVTDQVRKVVELLCREPDTRQAVIAIWNPSFDWEVTRDYPCNNLVYFKIRDRSLHMTVTNRSNDINWGLLSTNVVQFGMLMGLVHACVHKVAPSVGTYTHQTDSLHVYLNNSYAHLATRPEFPLYDHVPALRFDGHQPNDPDTPLTLDEHDAAMRGAIDLLLRVRHDAFKGKLPDVWDLPRQYSNAEIWSSPMVTSFTNLLLCYEALKREEYESIMPMFRTAPPCDWLVMCGEYLYRALKSREKMCLISGSVTQLRHALADHVHTTCGEECAAYVREDWYND